MTRVFPKVPALLAGLLLGAVRPAGATVLDPAGLPPPSGPAEPERAAPPPASRPLRFSSAEYSVGQGAAALAAGDVDGDGHVDLVVANRQGQGLLVLRNDGKGSFPPVLHDEYPLAGGPEAVAMGDLDGDGKPDLVVASRRGQRVTVLRNDGKGGFPPALRSDHQAGRGPCAVVLGDVDGDGKLDLVVASRGSGSATVLRNDGTGRFPTDLRAEYALGEGAYGIALADVNGDGRPDLLVSGQGAAGTGTVSVLLNLGAGLFLAEQRAEHPIGLAAYAMAPGDLRRAGAPDLVVASPIGDRVAVLPNGGGGHFQLAARQDYAVGSAPVALALADLDGDGAADLVVANRLGGTVSVLRNRGDGSFVNRRDIPVGQGPMSVVAADVNGDGRMDIVVASQDSGTITVLQALP